MGRVMDLDSELDLFPLPPSILQLKGPSPLHTILCLSGISWRVLETGSFRGYVHFQLMLSNREPIDGPASPSPLPPLS